MKAQDGEDDRPIKLTQGRTGESYRVTSIPGDEGCVERLLSLAILPGAEVELVEDPSVGAVMIDKDGDRIALSRSLASEIEVRPVRWRERKRERGRGR